MLSKIKDYLQGNLNYANKDSLPTHIQEQVLLRAFLCKSCLDATKCHVCKCSTPQMFFSPSKKDSLNRWAEFLSHAQWEALKLNYESYAEFFKELNSRTAEANSQGGNNKAE